MEFHFHGIWGIVINRKLTGFPQGKKGEKDMKISNFSEKVAALGERKKPINASQVKEILRVINDLTHGDLYRIIRSY